MEYRAELLVPANTPAATPAEASMRLNKGLITRVALLIPAGQGGMVYYQILRGASQLWPSTPEEAFRGDDAWIEWEESFPLEDEPLTLILRGWSPGTTYDHSLYVHVEVLALDQAEEAQGLRGLLRRLGELVLGREA